MPNKETLIKDLNDVCQQTNAQWFCCADVYTTNISEDEEKFVKIFRDAGFLKKDILFGGYAQPEYGGGLRFNYKDVTSGGYMLPVSEKYKAPVVFAGFETDFDQETIYHECAHLYQRKHDFFSKKMYPDSSYRKYLKEVHANTFASMVMLLRAEDVLSFKRQQLYCLASDVQTFNQRSKKNNYYISLPIVLELVKAVRREGRANTLHKFSKNENIDFEKIAFYTADFVRKYAYSPHEFYQINHNMSFSSYELLKQKAKAWRVFGERYASMEMNKKKQREEYYQLVENKRRSLIEHKIRPLPEVDEKAKVINAVCAIDVLNTRLCQDFGICTDLDNIISQNSYYYHDISDEKAKEEVLKISGQMADIYQKWRKNMFFKKLFSKINHPDTRDELWHVKFKKEREIFEGLQISNQR